MPRRGFLLFVAVFILAGAPSICHAQSEADSGNISGTGAVLIKRSPELLRLHLQVSGQGKDAKDALGKLKSRKEAVVAKLVELGASKDSVKTEDAHVSVEDNARRRQMESMVRDRMRQQGRRGAKKEEAKPVTLTMALKAEWPLKGQNSDETLVESHKVQEAVRGELAKLAESKELSPEEEELAEEMQQMNSFNDGEPKPGDPTFLFVARISDEERAKALAAAFEKAKTQAMQLSKAANVKLGPLESLRSNEAMNEGFAGYPGYGNDRYMYQMMMQQAQQRPDDGPLEAIGDEPGKVAVSITVMASFKLKE
ncbi:MAG TPA: SIMPL domain-containing protein [Pirellulales bacterium]|jgi:uncharacterized protein YggE